MISEKFEKEICALFRDVTEVGNNIIRFLMHKKVEADTDCQWRIQNPVKNL